MADLEWQFSNVGSAPSLSNKEQTSTRDLDAASCRGVNCHKSIALTQAPCFISISVTSMCPYEQALCNGTRPLKLKISITHFYLNITIKYFFLFFLPFIFGMDIRTMSKE